MTEFELADGLLDNHPVIAGRYIAHIAVPCRALEEAARWYSEVLGAQPYGSSKTASHSASAGSAMVCHLERRAPKSTHGHIRGISGSHFCRTTISHECATT